MKYNERIRALREDNDFSQTKIANLLNICLSSYICIALLLFSRRTHRVRTAKMSLYIENLSKNASFRRFR